MALVLNDRVKETTTTTGTGTVNLAGAETGFESFVAGIGNSNTCYYAIVHQTADEFEVGLGTVTDATPDTLARTTIISSSNSDSAVNFSAGTKDVFCTLPASKAVFEDASDNVGIGTTNGDVANDGVAARTYVGIIGSSNRGVLNIGSTAADGADGGKISFVNGANAIADIYSDADSGSQTNGFLQFVTGQTARMRITSSGMVGIGSSDPDTDGYSYAEDLVIKAGASTSDGAGISINSGSREYGVISFLDSSSYAGEIFYQHTSDSLYFKTAAANRWKLDSSGNMTVTGNITAYGSVSDERLKDNIEVIDNAVDKVKELKGVTFTYKKDGEKSTGLIAQDLEKVLPEAVYTSETIADEREGEESEEHLAIRYGNTVGLLVEAIKEQQEQIETLKAKVKELEDK